MNYENWITLSECATFESKKINSTNIKIDQYVSTENLMPYRGGLIIASSMPKGRINEYRKRDILISNIRPYFKKIWYAKHNGGCSADVLTVRSMDNIDSKYLYYVLSDDYFFDYVMKGSKGTKMPRGDKNHIMQYRLRIPPLQEQKAIAKILSSLDDKIELNNKINRKLEEMAQVLYKQWFVDFEFPNEDGEPYKSSGGEMVESELGLIPKGWVVDSLTNIANFKNGLAVKKYAPSEDEKSIPVLKIKELRNGDCDENSDRVTIDFPEDYIIQNGDLIFSWSGTLMVDFWTGKVAGLNQHLFKIDSNKYDRWFYYFWVSYHLTKFQNIASSMATTMGHIKRSDLKKSKVLIPTNEILYKGFELFEPLISKTIMNRNEINKLKKIRDTLLPKLMSGEIEVPIEV